MECKNCTYQLKTEDKYCRQCGAQVINYRLILKHL
ncbi:zinc-ribbon domain-containing protein [Mesonia sp.]